MIKQKEMHLLFLLFIGFALMTRISAQMPDSSTTLDMISDGMKSVFNLDHMLKTFRKISDGMIPFPLFVPIVPKNKVIELLRGKKSTKGISNAHSSDTLQQISESNIKLNNLPVPMPMPMQMPIPMMSHHMFKMNPSLSYDISQMPQITDQMFFNVRPPQQEVMSEMPFVINEGLSVGQNPLMDQMKPNDLNLDSDYEQSENNDNNDNNYAERFESDMSSEELNNSGDKRTPTAQDVLHNWQIIDEELKKIGQQLGKLGKYLNRNRL